MLLMGMVTCIRRYDKRGIFQRFSGYRTQNRLCAVAFNSVLKALTATEGMMRHGNIFNKLSE